MSTTYGLTPAGFIIKTQDIIIAELQDAFRQATGNPNLPFGVNSVFDQLVGVVSDLAAPQWELAQAVYLSQFPDTASGVSLANAGAVTGQAPISATYSTVTLTITGTPGTVITAGSRAGIPSTATAFATTATVTIPAGSSITVDAQATLIGALTAPAGTLTQILTPIAGWASVTNAADAVVGTDQETDAAFRARRATELVTAEGGTITAMQNFIRSTVPGVTFVGGIENRTDSTDGNGLPPHSVCLTVVGGTDANVAAAIWASKMGGIATYGTSSASVTDSFGHAQTVYWKRGANVPMYLAVTLTRASDYPADGDSQVMAALLAYVNGLDAGGTDGVVANWRLLAALGAIPGVTGVTILQDRNPAPTTSANTTMGGSEKPTLDSANVSIT